MSPEICSSTHPDTPREPVAETPRCFGRREAILGALATLGAACAAPTRRVIRTLCDEASVAEGRCMSKNKLFFVLEARFSKESPYRPSGVQWADVRKALEARPDLLFSLSEMERTGGGPDVVAVEDNAYIFADVSPESPEGRRYMPYAKAKVMADEMGVEMMSRRRYYDLQQKIQFMDKASWSWISKADLKGVPDGIALYGDWTSSSGHFEFCGARNGAPHGGWRGVLKVPKAK